jgi:hypothetical protein
MQPRNFPSPCATRFTSLTDSIHARLPLVGRPKNSSEAQNFSGGGKRKNARSYRCNPPTRPVLAALERIDLPTRGRWACFPGFISTRCVNVVARKGKPSGCNRIALRLSGSKTFERLPGSADVPRPHPTKRRMPRSRKTALATRARLRSLRAMWTWTSALLAAPTALGISIETDMSGNEDGNSSKAARVRTAISVVA